MGTPTTRATSQPPKPDAASVDEFASAEHASVAVHHVVQAIGPDDLHRPTPCRDWYVEALGDHLIDTISRLGVAAGIPTVAPRAGSIDERLWQLTQPILAGWRDRGLAACVLGLAQQTLTTQSRASAGFDPPVSVPANVGALDRLVPSPAVNHGR